MDELLGRAFPEGAAADRGGLRVGGLDPDSDWARFLGPGSEHEQLVNSAWISLVDEVGAADELAADHGVTWDTPAVREQLVLALAGADGQVVDVVAMACRQAQVRHRWEFEAAFARHTARALPEDLAGLHGQDIAPLRSALLTPDLLADVDYRALDAGWALTRFNRAVTALGAYQALPHHIPGPAALDVVTCAELEPAMKADLRLPGGWALVMHDAVPLHAATADDQSLSELLEHGRIDAGRRPAVIGALLRAQPGPELRLDTRLGWLWLTSVDEAGRRHRFLQPAAFGAHPAGRVLYSYAAQLAFGNWTPPAAPTEPPGGERLSQRAVRRAVRTPEAAAGAYQGVHVLRLTPPPERPTGGGTAARGTGNGLVHGTWRRAHWRYRVRVGVRTEEGRLVGPVYKTGVEGQTFTYETRFVTRRRIRSDLPLREETTLYTLPGP
ncbi:hypothetical protein ACFY4B_26980 [Kitasatospora sp. NPDC001261]|uniref:hypothetical protein n=1 Tax=Kitasatospora sp. NPDC001261 TaxID=3364012 RepID=UPI00367ECC08